MQTFTTLHADAERQFPALERQLEDARAVVALYKACVVRDPRDTESVFVDSDLRNAAESAEKTIRTIEQGLATLAARRSRIETSVLMRVQRRKLAEKMTADDDVLIVRGESASRSRMVLSYHDADGSHEVILGTIGFISRAAFEGGFEKALDTMNLTTGAVGHRARQGWIAIEGADRFDLGKVLHRIHDIHPTAPDETITNLASQLLYETHCEKLLERWTAATRDEGARHRLGRRITALGGKAPAPMPEPRHDYSLADDARRAWTGGAQ